MPSDMTEQTWLLDGQGIEDINEDIRHALGIFNSKGLI